MFFPRAQQYLLAGVLTAIPLIITWVLFEFIFNELSKFGMPWVKALSTAVHHYSPTVAGSLLTPWFQNVMAVFLTLIALYFLGWLATRVIGKRLINFVEKIITRIPLVQTIYGATKKLLDALQRKPDGAQRVVLIDFPSSDMKAVGLVTKMFTDAYTGEELVAVYVPTTPNPTSGYVEILPIHRVISTNWTMDEAMTFVMSGGAVGPDIIHYSRSYQEEHAHRGKM